MHVTNIIVTAILFPVNCTSFNLFFIISSTGTYPFGQPILSQYVTNLMKSWYTNKHCVRRLKRFLSAGIRRTDL